MSRLLTTPSSIPGIELPTGQAHLVDDAADGLRRCAHAFADNIGTITRAERILGSWTGEAQMACENRCAEQREQVNHFRHGATHAATALRRYADALRTNKLAIKRIVAEAEVVEARIAKAQRLADDAKTAATDSAQKAREVALQPKPHAAAEAERWGTRAADHAQDASRHAAAATNAADGLQTLKRRARTHLREIEDAAQVAVTTLKSVARDLPTVSYKNITGVGDLVLVAKNVTTSGAITLFTIRIGEGNTVVTEELGNGDTKVTLMKTVELGLDLTGGGKLKVGSAGGAEGGLSPHVSLLLTAALMSGRTFRFNNGKDAQEFAHDATHKDFGELLGDIVGLEDYDAEPIETFREGGFSTTASAFGGPAGGAIGAGAAIATKHDEQTGDNTTIYKTYAEASAALELLTAGASAAVKGTSATAVTRDKTGKITKLLISNAVETSAAVNVHTGELKDVARKIKTASAKLSSGNTKLVQTDIQLGVDDRNRAIVEAYLKTGGTESAASDLVRELDRNGQTEVNVYDRQIDGFELQVKGEGFGIEGKSTTTTDAIVSSSVKPPGDPEYHRRRPR